MPRKYLDRFTVSLPSNGSFNEAGADAPEIPRPRRQGRTCSNRFNEAGADAPEIPSLMAASVMLVLPLQ